MTNNPYRVLPQVSSLLESVDLPQMAPEFGAQIIRAELERIRWEIEKGGRPSADDVVRRCQVAIDQFRATRYDETINGTGVILHTNLGRAPVSEATAIAMARAARNYLPLEIVPETNDRGGRMDEISGLMRLLTGAEDTLVVNNNAAAVLLALASLGEGSEVIVSRGEAVEIGGGFRIPEVVAQSGCRLVEVGTTNRTYAADYARAISPSTGAILRVHPSNFRVEGFTTSPSTFELAKVANEHGIPFIDDLGSGALVETARFGLRSEPTVPVALEDGAALGTFSGDKLLGGPQAGLICGRSDLVRTIARQPLARAVRADKATLAGIAATLRHYIAGEEVAQIPIWGMISATVAELRDRANVIISRSGGSIVDSVASIGGGSLPGETLPSIAIALDSGGAAGMARSLRTGSPSVFPIVRDGLVLIDLRTVMPSQDGDLAGAIRNALVRATAGTNEAS